MVDARLAVQFRSARYGVAGPVMLGLVVIVIIGYFHFALWAGNAATLFIVFVISDFNDRQLHGQSEVAPV